MVTGVRMTTTGVLFMNADTAAALAVIVSMPMNGDPEA